MFRRILQLWRAYPVSAITFVALFAAVFLLVSATCALITFILPETFLGTARIKVWQDQANPVVLKEELLRLTSPTLLDRVVATRDLCAKFGERFGLGRPLEPRMAAAILKQHLDIRRYRNTTLFEIQAFDESPTEAAAIANAVATAYRDDRNRGQRRVEILDEAVPARKPIRPNKPLNLALGLTVGGVGGLLVGAVGALVVFKIQRRRQPETLAS